MAKRMKRIFKVGVAKVDDPCPGQPLDEAVRVLSRNYPAFRSFRLYEEDGVVENGCIVYTMRTPPAKTNG